MSLALQICFLAFAGIAAFYLYAFVRFYGIVNAEKPEWLNIRGSLSFLYDALPRIGDPNVQIELHRIAFGPRSRRLQSPMAVSYANRIRLLGGSALALFIVGVIGFITSAP